MSPHEAKILMLKRITRRLRRRLQNEQQEAKKYQDLLAVSQKSITKLREALLKSKTSGALATAGLDPKYQLAYENAQKILANDAYGYLHKEGLKLYSFLDATHKDLVQWIVHILADGIYDLEFVREIKN